MTVEKTKTDKELEEFVMGEIEKNPNLENKDAKDYL